ncbi:hypothetical protein HZZ13_06485 [Bradyrhizobium sp. CNPSo 4010]|uniref:Uncharacterized protein n=1 Tax=Bradyrhizobium agreste TaxID=2751811 RepID=A0ABS0PJR5_9BRAD|nr:hypothetical protein [Bradyrhizobium agreste]MBH5397438.1 hypothetical protein [Bradyrhizobium agreste]
MSMRKIILGVVAAAALAVAYAAIPRQADLRAFDPAEMARLEAAMWRDYYDKRYAALFLHLYHSIRAQFGFSPLQSLRVALSAAEAAKTFQPTRSRGEAAAALPPLTTYYRNLASAAPLAFDVEQAARLELDWWQARREAVAPRDHGLTIARVAALTYGRADDDSGIRRFGVDRAVSRCTGRGDHRCGLGRDRGAARRGLWTAQGECRTVDLNTKKPRRCRGFDV